jgi:hypothetical protein
MFLKYNEVLQLFDNRSQIVSVPIQSTVNSKQCGVWGFTSFEVANYLIFREKVPKFPPDHSYIQYFLIAKRSKSLSQQGFKIYSASST